LIPTLIAKLKGTLMKEGLSLDEREKLSEVLKKTKILIIWL